MSMEFDAGMIQRSAARTQAIDYRRQLLRIVDQIERDYKLGKHAETFAEAAVGPMAEMLGVDCHAELDVQTKKV